MKGYQTKTHVDKSVKPVAQNPRRISFSLREPVEKKLKQLMDLDIIERVDGPTPWVSPIVVVPKSNGDIRLCVDMRQANQGVIQERHPIPTFGDMLDNMSGSTVFSKLDLNMGFHQIELDEASRDITTFVTHARLFRYKRLMFVIRSAPELYQHIIRQVISGCLRAENIADDIIVHVRGQKDHDKNLAEVMERVKEQGLSLNESKCEFALLKMEFVGHLLSERGIQPTDARVKAVVEARIPENAKEVKSFLGLVTYCAKFIPNLATKAEPLRRVSRQGQSFSWGEHRLRLSRS